MGSCLRRNPELNLLHRWGSASASFPQKLIFIGSLRRQGPIMQPLDRWWDGFLPAQEPRTELAASLRIGFGIVCQNLIFIGSLRRQGPIMQPLERRRNGFLPAQEPRTELAVSLGSVSASFVKT